MRALGILILVGGLALALRASAPWMDSSMGMLQGELTARYGPGQRLRIQRGLAQAARCWGPGDGGAGEFEAFVRAQFAGTPEALEGLSGRAQAVAASLDLHLGELGRTLRDGAGLPVDALLGGYDPAVHVPEDCFGNKLAFAVLLNFPLTSLAERARDGASWSDRQWAWTWLADRFALRIPASALQARAEAAAAGRRYRAGIGLRLRQLRDAGGGPLVPPGCADLKAGIRALYARGPAGTARQRELQKAKERIAGQALPALEPGGAPEPDTRCQVLLGTFRAAREVDRWAPLAPTRMARSFERERQIPEARVRGLLEKVLGSPLAARVAGVLRSRLGRPLEPFDLYCDGRRPEAARAGPPLAFPRGAPGPAFTEALAALERAADPDPPALDFWRAFASAGEALVELEVWHWMYGHPGCTPAELQAAMAAIAASVWNRAYAPLLGQRGCLLLASDARLVTGSLGLSDRFLSHLIACQIRRAAAPGKLRETLERAAGLGRLTPDLWLERATGSPLGAEALLEAAERGLAASRWVCHLEG